MIRQSLVEITRFGLAGGAAGMVPAKESLLLVAVGALAAVPAAVALSQYVRSQLYGISPADTVTVIAVGIVLALVALGAALAAAWRAAKLEPMQALRME